MWLRQACISMRIVWISLDHYCLCMWVYTDWPKGISGETLAGRRACFPMKCHFTWKSSRWIAHWPRRPAQWKHSQLALGLLMPSFLWAPLTVPWQGQIASTAPSTKTFWGLRFLMAKLVLWYFRKEKDGGNSLVCLGRGWGELAINYCCALRPP